MPSPSIGSGSPPARNTTRPAGRLDRVDRFNVTRTDYRYDDADRLTGIRQERTVGLLADYDFQLDGKGNRTSVTIENSIRS